MAETITVTLEQLKNIVFRTMTKMGMNERDASIAADVAAVSDGRGMRTHGLDRFVDTYPKIIQTDPSRANREVKILKETPSAVYIDCNHCIGTVGAVKAMEIAIRKAKETGACVASVVNGGHCGMTAYYPLMAVKEGMIAFFVSGTVQLVVPYGGAKPVMSNAPWCLAVPGGKEYYTDPIMIDAACSEVAAGKVDIARKLGKKIPTNWILDKEGNPTDDPGKFYESFAMQPFGGIKGSCVTAMWEIMSSVLSGGAFGGDLKPVPDKDKPDNYGYFLYVIDPDKFIGREAFAAGVDRYARMIKECPPAPGFAEVFLPGEIEAKKYNAAVENGVEYEAVLLERILSVLKKFEILSENATLDDMLNM